MKTPFDLKEGSDVDAVQLLIFANQLNVPQLDEESCESLAELIAQPPFGPLVRAGLMLIKRCPESSSWYLMLSQEGVEQFTRWRTRGLQ